ncbi:MAG: DUF2721 domain-containing protein [Breznakibacter sp.]
MTDFSLSTPTLLFSAVSLILLAYTNRFMGYAQLVRSLYKEFRENKDDVLLAQIRNLRKRLQLTRFMQLFGILSLFLCVVSMFLVYVNIHDLALLAFGVALLLLIASLAVSAWEIHISTLAVEMHLRDMEEKKE